MLNYSVVAGSFLHFAFLLLQELLRPNLKVFDVHIVYQKVVKISLVLDIVLFGKSILRFGLSDLLLLKSGVLEIACSLVIFGLICEFGRVE